ncbi:Protein C21orf2, partial [Orchesella cincta]
LNKIRTLADFGHCRNLVELYVRRNEIRDLSELCYLQELPRLKRLLLAENPCVETAGAAYRHTVLRCLPNLEVLDNNQVSQDEVDQAFKIGLILEHPTERVSPEPVYYREESPPAPVVAQPGRRSSTQYDYEDEPTPAYRNANNVSHSPPADYYYQNQNGEDRSRSRTPEQSPPAPLTNNCTNNGTVISNSNTNGNQILHPQPQSPPSRSVVKSDTSAGASSPPWDERFPSPTNNNGEVPSTARRVSHSPDYYPQRGSNEREITNGSGTGGYQHNRRASTDYAEIRNLDMYEETSPQHLQNHRNALPAMAHTQRTNISPAQPLRSKPRAKSSNLLSAVLCLIPELDWQSLEVVELAVRRRMDELISD